MKRFGFHIIYLITLACLHFAGEASAEDALAFETPEWRNIESQYCTIRYRPEVDLKKINRKIDLTFFDFNPQYYKVKVEEVEQKLAEKFDRLFERVQQILDMFPRKIHINVAIYEDQQQLDDCYYQLFGPSSKQRISYYVHKYTTIYTTESAISEEVLAHEIAHAIIDHYFLILPPEKIKELLAQYVEFHLED
ncbi:MAG: hypothetical protein JW869_03280 [Candidatus Omnitrophica bacterium]|nr:hypothetical protein [Candidatus Omnitrophota bacterium]